MRNKVTVNENKINKHSGVQYRVSGNLFIASRRSKTVPSDFGNGRSVISRFSVGAGIRMRRYLRECRSHYTNMVTLTYPQSFPTNGEETKEHLRRFLQEMQRYVNRQDTATRKQRLANPESHGIDTQDYSSFWFLEFQGRGAPHYHIFTTHNFPKEWIANKWYSIVNSEDIRHLHAGTRIEKLATGRAGTISYASKYAAKQEQKDVPEGFEKVGRFWGVYGCRVTMSADIFVSNNDSTLSNVINTKRNVHSYLEKLVSEGKAEVLRREDGICIIVVHDLAKLQRLRYLVSALGAQCEHHHDLFHDAECDEGFNYV